MSRSWTDPSALPTILLAPYPSTIAFTVLVALLFPVLLHQLLYRIQARAANAAPPAFVLVGPSGAGKTSLALKFAQSPSRQQPHAHYAPPKTHTTLTLHSYSVSLPPSHVPASARHRADNDPLAQQARRCTVVDTPGHSKLRHVWHECLTDPPNDTEVHGLIFVVDASRFGIAGLEGEEERMEIVRALVDALACMVASSKGHGGKSKTVVNPDKGRLLVAATKTDLFTASSASAIASLLENGIASLLSTSVVGVVSSMDTSIDAEEDVKDDTGPACFRRWWREGGDEAPEGQRFSWENLKRRGLKVDIRGGSTWAGQGDSHVDAWWDWFADAL